MFVGHRTDIELNSWKVLPQYRSTQTLVNQGGQLFLQSNICPHQGSRIRSCSTGTESPACPYHGWTWKFNGEPQGSGTSECTNKAPLTSKPVQDWNGFLFEALIPLSINLAGNYRLEEYRIDNVKANFVPIMDLFLDVDHIPKVHNKVYDIIGIKNTENIEWKTWSGGSAQIVDKNKAVWMAMYPYTMFEYQPGAVFVTVSEPVSESETKVHVFKYKDHSHNNDLWITNCNVWETAWAQDRQQAELLEPGWRDIPKEHLDVEKRNYRGWLWG